MRAKSKTMHLGSWESLRSWGLWASICWEGDHEDGWWERLQALRSSREIEVSCPISLSTFQQQHRPSETRPSMECQNKGLQEWGGLNTVLLHGGRKVGGNKSFWINHQNRRKEHFKNTDSWAKYQLWLRIFQRQELILVNAHLQCPKPSSKHSYVSFNFWNNSNSCNARAEVICSQHTEPGFTLAYPHGVCPRPWHSTFYWIPPTPTN